MRAVKKANKINLVILTSVVGIVCLRAQSTFRLNYLEFSPPNPMIPYFSATGRQALKQNYHVQIERRKTGVKVQVHQSGKLLLSLQGILGRVALLRDNSGADWLYFVAAYRPRALFYLCPLSQCHGQQIDLAHYGKGTACIPCTWSEVLPGLMNPYTGRYCLDAITRTDDIAIRAYRVRDRLWLWSVDPQGWITLQWAHVPKAEDAPGYIYWKGFLLNPLGECLGISQEEEVFFVEKALKSVGRSAGVDSKLIRKFQRLRFGPEKWALGLKLAMSRSPDAVATLLKELKEDEYSQESLAGGPSTQLQNVFRAMAIELVGLAADKNREAQEFLLQGLKTNQWAKARWLADSYRFMGKGATYRGVGLSVVAIGLSGQKELWTKILNLKRRIESHKEWPTLYKEKVGYSIVVASFYRWIIQQVGKEKFVRDIWFQRPIAEWWERWERSDIGQGWIEWYAHLVNQPWIRLRP